jgi:hypothetical protein
MAEEGKKGAVSTMKYLSLYGEKGGRHTFWCCMMELGRVETWFKLVLVKMDVLLSPKKKTSCGVKGGDAGELVSYLCP